MVLFKVCYVAPHKLAYVLLSTERTPPGSTILGTLEYISADEILSNPINTQVIYDRVKVILRRNNLKPHEVKIVLTVTKVSDAAPVVGPEGPPGPEGSPGPQGVAGPEGPPGSNGAPGAPGAPGTPGTNGTNGTNGSNGSDGVDGLSAYEIAVANGFVGSEATWLASLEGPQGPQGIQGAQGIQGPQGPAGTNGTNGTNGADGAAGATGPAGPGVPTGGTANQALLKLSGADFDSQWTTLTKALVGLGNVDNTSDLNKPVSTATQSALDLKLNSSAVSAFSLTLLDDPTQAAFRTTLGLGSAALAASGDFAAAVHVHAVATGASNGFMSAADKTKLDGISGTNTGDQIITLTGDATGSGAGSFAVTLATVNAGPIADLFHKLTVNSKGLVTASSAVNGSDIAAAYGSVAANRVWASPSGSAGNPTFRKLVITDLPSIAAGSILGNNAGVGSTPVELTGAQATAMLADFTSSTKGLVPSPGGVSNTTDFLRRDGTWAAPAGGTGSTDYGMITTIASGMFNV